MRAQPKPIAIDEPEETRKVANSTQTMVEHINVVSQTRGNVTFDKKSKNNFFLKWNPSFFD